MMSGAARLVTAGVTAAVVGAALTATCLVRVLTGYGTATIPSESMRPTFEPGDRMFYERIDGTDLGSGGAGGDRLRRGDVVLYSAPERYGDVLVVQRVVATGGERVASRREGWTEEVTVDGRKLDEPYLPDGRTASTSPYEVTVPEGRLFLLGDNRGNARDSRSFLDDRGGTVAVDAVVGRVVPGSALRWLLVGAAAGVLVLLVGIVLGIVGAVGRRREVPVGVAMPEWAARP
ncbi:signal peptidase I [Streptomyces fragilis]|uniref:Signal peptidase I n=1 Tax=Streptomyces fragilis TaxID=67301 RepID=A0ABV2YFM7_9ACTN|nr:signal peptidase I [Streptomyces fragilis]